MILTATVYWVFVEHMPDTLLNSVDGLEFIKTVGCLGAVSFPEEENEALEIK